MLVFHLKEYGPVKHELFGLHSSPLVSIQNFTLVTFKINQYNTYIGLAN